MALKETSKSDRVLVKCMSDMPERESCLEHFQEIVIATNGLSASYGGKSQVENGSCGHRCRVAGAVRSELDVQGTKLGEVVDSSKGALRDKTMGGASSYVPHTNINQTMLVHKKDTLPDLSHHDTYISYAATSWRKGAQAKAFSAKAPVGKDVRKKSAATLMSALNIEDPAMYLHRLYAAGALVGDLRSSLSVGSSGQLMDDLVPPPEEAVPLPKFK